MTGMTQKEMCEDKKLQRIAEEEMDELHRHNAKGCYGQGTYL